MNYVFADILRINEFEITLPYILFFVGNEIFFFPFFNRELYQIFGIV